MHPDFPPSSAPLEVDRVEWVPASSEVVHVHLLGRWVDRPVVEPLVLLVGTEGRRQSFGSLSHPPAGVLAVFAVPNELRARLAVDLALQIGAHELPLPGAQTGTVTEDGDPPEPSGEAEVIDRAVLAERRARRAELAEESLARRAADAEKTAGTLETQLANLEERLTQAREERDELEAALSDAERRLKVAQQREYAEQQQRIEAQDEVERVRREQQHEVADLRRRLQAVNERATNMAREVDRGRRGIAEALQRSAADRAALRRAQDELRDRSEAVPAGEASIEQREELERSLADGSRLARELETALAGEQDTRAELERARIELQRAQREAELLREESRRHQAALEQANRTMEVELRAALEAERRAFAEQVEKVERHVAGLRAQLAAGQLRDELDTERDARQAAERTCREELDQQVAEALQAVRRVRGESQARGARDAVVQRLAGDVLRTAASVRAMFQEESRRLEDELARERQGRGAPAEQAAERTRIEDELRGLRAELERVQRVAEDESAQAGMARAVIAGLESAAERLREQVPAMDDEAPEGPSTAAVMASEPHIPHEQDGTSEGGAEQAPAEPGTPLAPRLLATGARRAVPWLSQAITRVAERDPETAARLVVALLPVQRLLVSRDATYDLTVTELGTFRVQLHPGATSVEPRPEPGSRREIDFHLEGSAGALAQFAAGGLRRRPKGTHFEGRRRRLRRLLRDLRDPVQLSTVARSGVAIEPGLVLAALAAATDPVLPPGHTFSVAWDVSGERGGTWTVHVADGGLRVEPGAPADGATAIVHVPQRAFLPLLGGLAPPPGQQATATGNVHAAALLRQWFDAAQGLS